MALDELFTYGYAGRAHHWHFFARHGFLSELLLYSVAFYLAALLAVAVRSATGVTLEREGGTWDGLLATPLEPAEIIRAKVLGAIAAQRGVLFLVLAPWLFGLALGALHPIGLLLGFTGLVVFMYFASALGTLFSLRSKSSTRAVVRTIGVLLILNLGTVVVAKVLLRSSELAMLFGCTPILLYELPLSTHIMQAIMDQFGKRWLFLGFLSAYVLAYAALGWLLQRTATRRFDRVADRAVM